MASTSTRKEERRHVHAEAVFGAPFPFASTSKAGSDSVAPYMNWYRKAMKQKAAHASYG